ncbi:MAG: hypothetical protein N5P05_002680 [Chroococcopsis gigantea SAG 12.99]|jgi:filamentous hemagglutinin family protein|nr:filamentous hemagglutinin N-terminal domain-containing protein [Chlorogloea purpurea SAG 13.99]MDV3001074.1 hypothetical protein [Chroococcopsis gigantea SAG 12.99]
MASISNLTEVMLCFGLLIVLASPLKAQVRPDSTLGGESSRITPNHTIKGIRSDLIDGGAKRGANLFHSFAEFNIKEGGAIYFSNPEGVGRIFTRVTGNNISSLFGKLGVSGKASLFLLNPNGIIFGPGASLDVGGSFLATTASWIQLSDGTVFSARNPQGVPLLAINVPIGMGFLEPSGRIEVRGGGHNLITPADIRQSTIPFGGAIPSGLALGAEHTLALLGGDILFDGGIVTAPSGNVEIGSVARGEVKITFTRSDNFTLNYDGVKVPGDISLRQRALIDASGISNGNISFYGRNINFTDASLAWVENQGTNPLGTISLNAEDTLSLTGITEVTKSSPGFGGFVRPSRGLISQALSEGNGANINIRTNRLIVRDTGNIYLSAFGTGSGGDLNIQARDSVGILGISAVDPFFGIGSIIATATVGSGKAGNVNLVTRYLSLRDGGLLTSTVFGGGSGGDMNIQAAQTIDLRGFNAYILIPSLISSSTQGAGPGGNLTIATRKLTLTDGGRVDSSTLAFGKAGNLTIDAADSVAVSGKIPGSLNPSLIVSSANRVDPRLIEALGLPEIPTGASGNLFIRTGRLSVADGASITVRNDGTGDAGNLRIETRSIRLDGSGSITASTLSGNGGNIDLAANRIELRNNGNITATAGGTGNGGNIAISTGLLFSLDNSSISANAFSGRGGQVRIDAKGTFFSQPTQITATSVFGLDGVVSINTPDSNIQNSLEPLELGLISPEETIARSCLARRNEGGGSFTYSRTGGVPISPESGIDEREALSVPSLREGTPTDSSSITPGDRKEEYLIATEPRKPGEPIVRGTEIVRTADGRILLVAGKAQNANIICK